MITIELIDNKKINSIIPLLKILNTSISEETLEERLSDMIKEGYQCVGAFDNDKLIGICGLWILTKYYVGKHIEPDNMMILPEYQNQKIGSKMMQWIYGYAKNNDCVASELNCYINNKAAHNFWEKESYKVIALHFQKDL
ncbi:GNAT family N-acetyltransferase [Sulfurovum sp.]|uniref:GNAT family N-acetyltransferase n=1 Tax=Sulfurovum sp. TaxID=1969726 RepID=UPI0035653964